MSLHNCGMKPAVALASLKLVWRNIESTTIPSSLTHIEKEESARKGQRSTIDSKETIPKIRAFSTQKGHKLISETDASVLSRNKKMENTRSGTALVDTHLTTSTSFQ